MDHSTLPSIRFEWDHLVISSGHISTQEQAAAVIALIQVLSEKLLPKGGPAVQAIMKKLAD